MPDIDSVIKSNSKYLRWEDLTGKKIGMFSVLKRTEKRTTTGYIVYIVKCDCGHVTELSSRDMKRYQSCGCKRIETLRQKSFKGFGEIGLGLWSSIIYGAKSRNFKFDISIEFAWNLFLKQNRRCALSNELIYFGTYKSKTRPNTASLDRIDSKKGYLKDNVQWVHKTINLMKQNINEQEFFIWCKKIANYKLP
jgi:hypothetical protein